MSEKKEPQPEAKAAKSSGGGSKLVAAIAFLGLVNMGGTGFLAYKSLHPPPPPPAADKAADKAGEGAEGEHAEAAPAEGEHEEHAAKEEHGEEKKHGGGEGGHETVRPRAAGSGPAVMLEPFIVNLNEEESSRYLKASLELELGNDYFADGLSRSKSAVRDEVLRYLSSLSVRDTLGEQHKLEIREAVAQRVDRILGRGAVRNVFFAEFVVQ